MRIFLFLLISFFIFHGTASAASWSVKQGSSFNYNIENCGQPNILEAGFHKGMFFGKDVPVSDRSMSKLLSFEELEVSQKRAYTTDERLLQRVYLDPASQTFKGDSRYLFNPKSHKSEFITLPIQTIAGVLENLKDSLKAGFARYISYVDAGHLHIQIPISLEKELESKIADPEERNQIIMQHPEVKFLYHTAEIVHLIDEDGRPLSEEHAWWYLNRNVIGSLSGHGDIYTLVKAGTGYNTYGELPGYKELGPSIYFQGNKNGCFQLEHAGEVINLDMTFMMPPTDPEVMAQSPPDQ